MDTITFRTVVDREQVIRPPAGVILPHGALEVTVKPASAAPVGGESARDLANARLRQHRVSLGHATGADNEAIDADLARGYGNGPDPA